MDVTPETPQQTDARLRSVLRRARIEHLPGQHIFQEFPIADFPSHLAGTALAFVRDHQVWSGLVPASEQIRPDDCFRVICVHFAPELPNSGFVGWLASELKRQLGTGVFVVCGQNSADGGIFDYWGLPLDVADEAIAVIDALRAPQS